MPNKKRNLRRKISHFLGSYRGKIIFNFFYGFGASLAIMGTMFKLLHLDGANIALAIGLGTEVFIFALSAFEPPFRTYRWDDVFPVLKTHNEEDRPNFGNGIGGFGGSLIINGGSASSDSEGQTISAQPAQSQGFGGVIYSGIPGGQGVAVQGSPTQGVSTPGHQNPFADITPGQAAQSYGLPPQVQLSEEEAQTLSDTIKRMGEAVTQLNNMADITIVTEKYLNQLSGMAENLDRFSSATSSLADVSNVLLDSYRNITENSSEISDNSKGYVEQMGVLNKNLYGLNTIYEIQLKSISSQIDTIDRVNKGLLHIRDMYEGSMDGSDRFRVETENMAENLSNLNRVYSRMLQAMIPNPGFGAFGQNNVVSATNQNTENNQPNEATAPAENA
jgi:hypothetical protein